MQEGSQNFRALLQKAIQEQRIDELSDDPITQDLLREAAVGKGNGAALEIDCSNEPMTRSVLPAIAWDSVKAIDDCRVNKNMRTKSA